MQWNESGTKVASSSERSSARWPLTEQLPLGGGGRAPQPARACAIAGCRSAVGPPELGCRWARRAGRHVRLTGARFRVGAGSVVGTGLDVVCPSRTERLPPCGVRPARPVWALLQQSSSGAEASGPVGPGVARVRPWEDLGQCLPNRGASWPTVVRVNPGCWPGDVACLALGS